MVVDVENWRTTRCAGYEEREWHWQCVLDPAVSASAAEIRCQDGEVVIKG